MVEASDVSRLVKASAGGDQAAWDELVRRYSPLVMAVTRSYQLDIEDARDVSQTVWLRLVEHVAYLRTPEALPGWLATTTQRECWRQTQRRRRVLPVDPHTDSTMERGEVIDPDAGILKAELRQALRDGLGELSARDQQLLRLRAADPPRSYREISQLLGMRIGSVGPSIRRSLNKLRESNAMRSYLATNQTGDGGTGGDWRELAEVE